MTFSLTQIIIWNLSTYFNKYEILAFSLLSHDKWPIFSSFRRVEEKSEKENDVTLGQLKVRGRGLAATNTTPFSLTFNLYQPDLPPIIFQVHTLKLCDLNLNFDLSLLSELHTLTLDIKHYRDNTLSNFSALSHLYYLEIIRNGNKVFDLQNLGYIYHLSTGTFHVKNLASLTHNYYLNLNTTTQDPLTSVSSLSKIHSLRMNVYNQEIRDISEYLSRVHTLYLYNRSIDDRSYIKSEDLYPLRRCHTLGLKIDLTGIDLAIFANLYALYLDCQAGCEGIVLDTSDLGHLHTLMFKYCIYHKYYILSLNNLQRVYRLFLGIPISYQDLKPLARVHTLILYDPLKDYLDLTHVYDLTLYTKASDYREKGIESTGLERLTYLQTLHRISKIPSHNPPNLDTLICDKYLNWEEDDESQGYVDEEQDLPLPPVNPKTRVLTYRNSQLGNNPIVQQLMLDFRYNSSFG